jgi:biotin carboxyl carrier protein
VADVSVTAIGNGVYRVVEGDRSRLAYAAAAGDERWVFLDGRVYVLHGADRGSPQGPPSNNGARPQPSSNVAAPSRPARKKKRGDDHAVLAAPMPATVVRITVEPGQRVSKGEVLIVLEAMKMELPIRAPRGGVVKKIHCKKGELVQPGVNLLEIE